MQEETEIIGRYILAFVESTGKVSSVFERKTRDIFANNGLEISAVEEEGWYDAHSYAEAMHQVEAEVGEQTLTEAGAEQAKNVPWPEQVRSVSDGLNFLVEADKQAHRQPSGSYAGSYRYEKISDSAGRVGIFEHTPYPVANFKGVFKGGVRSLADSSTTEISSAEPRDDEQAAFEISW